MTASSAALNGEVEHSSAAEGTAGGPPPLLSVIVPVYNVSAYLDRCVASLVGQSFQHFEILLVDDGSTDGSGAICDHWARTDARVRVLHQSNRGQSAAKNRALSVARGSLIGFVDGDDWVEREMYETLIGQMRLNGANVGACAFMYVFPDRCTHAGRDTGQVHVYPRAKALLQMALQQDLMFESTLKVYARTVIGDARFPEGKLYEEVRFAMEMAPRLGTVVYVDRPYYHYLQGRAGSTNASFPEAKLAIVETCDAFAQSLDDEGLSEAARAMEAFTLNHVMRMHANAAACHAEPWMLRRLERDFRAHLMDALDNPFVNKGKALLFAVSPRLYGAVSRKVHRLHGSA